MDPVPHFEIEDSDDDVAAVQDFGLFNFFKKNFLIEIFEKKSN